MLIPKSRLNESFLKALIHHRKYLKEQLEAVEVILADSELIEEPIPTIPTDDYNLDWTWEQKVLWIINKMGTAYAEGIAFEIGCREPHILTRILPPVKKTLSKLRGMGQVEVIGTNARRLKYTTTPKL